MKLKEKSLLWGLGCQSLLLQHKLHISLLLVTISQPVCKSLTEAVV